MAINITQNQYIEYNRGYKIIILFMVAKWRTSLLIRYADGFGWAWVAKRVTWQMEFTYVMLRFNSSLLLFLDRS